MTPESVIQELMQTDLHRVIRTQHLTDDHCQVSMTRMFWYSLLNPSSISSIKLFGLLNPFTLQISFIET